MSCPCDPEKFNAKDMRDDVKCRRPSTGIQTSTSDIGVKGMIIKSFYLSKVILYPVFPKKKYICMYIYLKIIINRNNEYQNVTVVS